MSTLKKESKEYSPETEFDDEWVMQVIREAQEEQKQNPMTPEELVAEFKDLARYGRERARQLGITEDDIPTIIQKERKRREEKKLERMLLDGIRSGRGVEFGTKEWDAFWESIYAHIRERAKKPTS